MIVIRKKLAGTNSALLGRFLGRAQRAAGLLGEVNVLLGSDREIQELNRRYRGKDEPTDVLSFPADGGAGKDVAGDIAISVEMAMRNARGYGHGAAEEVKILLLHGILHLAGYDHERDNGSMARFEERLRKRLGLPGALIARQQHDDAAVQRASVALRRRGRSR